MSIEEKNRISDVSSSASSFSAGGEGGESPGRKSYRIESLSIFISVVLHFLVFAAFIVLYNLGDMLITGGLGGSAGAGHGSAGASGGISVSSGQLTEVSKAEESQDRESRDVKSDEPVTPVTQSSGSSEDAVKARVSRGSEAKSAGGSSGSGVVIPGARGSGRGYGTVEGAGFDSSGLGGLYSENTFNIRMKYPSNWVYVDQQNKRRLDGVTFWSSDNAYNPPPYIHLDVVDKYMFNSTRYRHKYDFPGFTGYYNDPEEMEGQVSQTVYIRTSGDKDYMIKLIMQGQDQFRSFQPKFFAIVRSFRSGYSIF